MNDAWSALAGVALGGLIGAAAQFASDRVRYRHERRERTLTYRRDAYTAFLSAVWTVYSQRLGMTLLAQRVVDPEEMARLEGASVIQLTQTHREVDVALAAVALAGPIEVLRAAQRVEAFVAKTSELATEENLAELNRLVDGYTARAQRHACLTVS